MYEYPGSASTQTAHKTAKPRFKLSKGGKQRALYV